MSQQVPETETQAVDRVRDMIREECQRAVATELATGWEALLRPILSNLDRRLTEMERSLALLIRGQALIESSLVDRAADDEPWRESLD